MSFLRSTMNTQPSGLMNPTSSLLSAPPGRLAAASSGLPQEAATTRGPTATISPTSPSGRSCPSSPWMQTIVFGAGTPTDSAPGGGSAGDGEPNGVTVIGEVVSVRP